MESTSRWHCGQAERHQERKAGARDMQVAEEMKGNAWEALILIPGPSMLPNTAHTARTGWSVGNREQALTRAPDPKALHWPSTRHPKGASTQYKCTVNQRKHMQGPPTAAAPSWGTGTAFCLGRHLRGALQNSHPPMGSASCPPGKGTLSQPKQVKLD